MRVQCLERSIQKENFVGTLSLSQIVFYVLIYSAYVASVREYILQILAALMSRNYQEVFIDVEIMNLIHK